MKKVVLAVLAVMFVANAGFAKNNQINIYTGIDFSGKLSEDFEIEYKVYGSGYGYYKRKGTSSDSKPVLPNVSVGVEYLRSFGNVFAVGLGVQYLPMRMFAGDTYGFESYLPLYLTCKLTPIPQVRGLFFKADLGANFVVQTNTSGCEKHGAYIGLGTGYEFDCGLIVSGMYGWYTSSLEANEIDSGFDDGKAITYEYNVNNDLVYSRFTLNVGYKFNF